MKTLKFTLPFMVVCFFRCVWLMVCYNIIFPSMSDKLSANLLTIFFYSETLIKLTLFRNEKWKCMNKRYFCFNLDKVKSIISCVISFWGFFLLVIKCNIKNRVEKKRDLENRLSKKEVDFVGYANNHRDIFIIWKFIVEG